MQSWTGTYKRCIGPVICRPDEKSFDAETPCPPTTDAIESGKVFRE